MTTIFEKDICSALISIRKKLEVFANGDFEILKTESNFNLSYIRKNKDKQILVINNLSNRKLLTDISIPKNYIPKEKGTITNLKNLINNNNIKVNLSNQNNKLHLKLSPYQTVWLEL